MQNGSKPDVVVIGSGLGGLAAACVLAARGYKVTVFEKNKWLGGKAAVLEMNGYRFDMGPTILTVPKVLKRIFEEAGKKLEDYLKLVELDPQWRSFFEDGSTLDLVTDKAKMGAAIEKRTPGGAEGYQKFMKSAERIHEISERLFFWKPVGGMMDTLSIVDMLKPSSLKDLLDIRIGKTVAEVIRSHVPDEQAAQMFDHYCQYVGSSPEQSPAVLCSIASMQTHEGVWYPIGGTRAVPEALVKLGRELGVTYQTETAIKRINYSPSGVTGVVTDKGETVTAGRIVSNSDCVRTFRELVEGPPKQKFLNAREYEPACSGVVLYLGLNRRYEHIQHHNFVFSRDPHEEFEYIYKKGEPAPDPTAYVCAPSFSEPDVAPEGGEALYVLVHTPYLRKHHDWKEMLPDYRARIIEKLKTTAGMEDLEERIVCEGSLTPQSINDRYHVLNGAIYGLASHGAYTGAFKPSNRNKQVKGLYLAGGSSHPGPGMPMVMMSGWIAADSLDKDMAG